MGGGRGRTQLYVPILLLSGVWGEEENKMAGRFSLHVDFILQATTIVFDCRDTALASNSTLADL